VPTVEERMKILEMIQTGKISPEEGARLLQALQAGGKTTSNGHDPRWLHIRITDRETGHTAVNVNIPLHLVNNAGFNALRYLTETTTWQQQKSE
jgi:hypothetical protein